MQIVKSIALVCATIFISSSAIQAADFTDLKGTPKLHSASALVINSDGEVIYGKDIDTVRSIASITKLMTAMVILDSGRDLN